MLNEELINFFLNNLYFINFILILFGSIIITNFFTPYSTIFLISNINNDLKTSLILFIIGWLASFIGNQISFFLANNNSKFINDKFNKYKKYQYSLELFNKFKYKLIGITFYLGPIKACYIFFCGLSNLKSKIMLKMNFIMSLIWSLSICIQGKVISIVSKYFGDGVEIKVFIVLLSIFIVNISIFFYLRKRSNYSL